jgi:molybdate transport system regulatory protein
VKKASRTAALRVRIDLAPGVSLGPGKIALLEHIAASGSLSQAARELGMSYRRGWLLLDDLNRAFLEPATTASVGGSGGGGAQLTPFGEALIETYRAIEQEASAAASKPIKWLAGAVRAGRTAGPERRPLSRPLANRPAPARKRARSKRDRATTRP